MTSWTVNREDQSMGTSEWIVMSEGRPVAWIRDDAPKAVALIAAAARLLEALEGLLADIRRQDCEVPIDEERRQRLAAGYDAIAKARGGA